jgi:acyl-coenzyme A thioesterase PaaI-like protein
LMGLTALDNATWGFATKCFVCDPHNPGGLRIPFYHDTEAAKVVAELCLSDTFSGAPQLVHGGIVLAVLDEAMAWAAIAIGGRFALTKEWASTFHRPVKVNHRHRVEAELTARADDLMRARAVVLDAQARPCTTASASLVPFGATQARSVIGEVRGDHDTAYLREDEP